MEAPDIDADDLRRTLSDLARLNTLFGGLRASFSVLLPLIRRFAADQSGKAPKGIRDAGGAPISILDVAAGDGFFLRELVSRGRREGIPLCGTALDLHPLVVQIARERCAPIPEIRVEEADALALPFPDASFDYAHSCLALHHFSPIDRVRALREMRRVARRGLLVNDLRRSRLAFVGIAVALRALGCHPVTQHDGPVSAQRAPSREEYRALIQESGMAGLRYTERLFFRSLLWWDGGP